MCCRCSRDFVNRRLVGEVRRLVGCSKCKMGRLSDENTGGHKHRRVRFIILLAYLRGIQYTSFSYFFGVPIYRAVKEVLIHGFMFTVTQHRPIINCVRRQGFPPNPSTQPATLALRLLRPSLHIFFAPHNAPKKGTSTNFLPSQHLPYQTQTSLIAALIFVPKLGQ